MSIVDELKKIDPKVTFSKRDVSTSRSTHPRLKLLEAIDNNIKYFNDPKFRVKGKDGKDKEPELFWEDDGEDAWITLRYSRTPIIISGTDDRITVKEKNLGKVLQALRDATANGEFDKQLLAIKDKRVKALAKGRSAKK